MGWGVGVAVSVGPQRIRPGVVPPQGGRAGLAVSAQLQFPKKNRENNIAALVFPKSFAKYIVLSHTSGHILKTPRGEKQGQHCCRSENEGPEAHRQKGGGEGGEGGNPAFLMPTPVLFALPGSLA